MSTKRQADNSGNQATLADSRLKRFALGCFIITSAFSVLALTGWLLNIPSLASLSPNYIPMAPGGAWILLAMCSAWLIYWRWPDQKRALGLVRAGMLAIILFNAALLALFLTNSKFDLEHLLVPNPAMFGQVPLWRTSPISSIAYLLASSSLLIQSWAEPHRKRLKNLVVLLSAVVFLIGFFVMLGYLYGLPFLYGTAIIPVALTTAAAVTCLGLGQLAFIGSSYWPVNAFVGESVRARLMRSIFPIIILITILQPWLKIYLDSRIIHPALLVALEVLVELAILLPIIFGISHYLGNELERSITERERSLELEQKNAHRTRVLLELFQRPFATVDEIIAFAIEEAVQLTDSEYGFIGLLDEQETTLYINSFSTKAVQDNAVPDKFDRISLADAGLWAEGLKQHRAFIVNDYATTGLEKKGLPVGHIPLHRFMGIPVIEAGRAVLFGIVANKPAGYEEADQAQFAIILESIWDLIANRRSEGKIQSLAKFPEENPYPVMRFAQDGSLLYANPSSQPLLADWGLEVGRQSPDDWLGLISKAFADRHNSEIEKTCAERIFSIYLVPILDMDYINVYGRDITNRKRMEKALRESELKYRSLFEDSAVPIWEEDFSQVKAFFEQLQASGVRDWRAYFDGHAEALAQCAALVKILDVNSACLKAFRVSSKNEIIRELPVYFIEESWLVFKEELIALAEGKIYFESENKILAYNGEIETSILCLSVAPGCQDTLARVLVSIIDITERKRAEEQIQAALAEKEILLREIHHRVKNNLAVVSSLLELQSRATQDESVQAAFQISQLRINAMSKVHEQLYLSPDLVNIDMARYMDNLIFELSSIYARDDIVVHVDVENVKLSIEQAIPCGLILNELLTNAMKYAFPSGSSEPGQSITVSMHPQAEGCTLTVSDNGSGLPDGFDWRESRSLGLRLVTRLVDQLKGALEVESGTSGAAFKITFPT